MDILFFFKKKGRPRMIRQCLSKEVKNIWRNCFCFFSTSKENEKTSTYRANNTPQREVVHNITLPICIYVYFSCLVALKFHHRQMIVIIYFDKEGVSLSFFALFRRAVFLLPNVSPLLLLVVFFFFFFLIFIFEQHQKQRHRSPVPVGKHAIHIKRIQIFYYYFTKKNENIPPLFELLLMRHFNKQTRQSEIRDLWVRTHTYLKFIENLY